VLISFPHFTRRLPRRGGSGEIYAYLPMNETNTKALLAVPPNSKANSDYGISVGRCAWVFEPGAWTTVAERVKLNDVGSANGKQSRSLG
jgi:hypothetical protein